MCPPSTEKSSRCDGSASATAVGVQVLCCPVLCILRLKAPCRTGRPQDAKKQSPVPVCWLHAHHMDRQSFRYTDRQAAGQRDLLSASLPSSLALCLSLCQAEGQAERLAGRQRGRQRGREAEREAEAEGRAGRQRGRGPERGREAGRQADRPETDRQEHEQTHADQRRQTDADGQTAKPTDGQMDGLICLRSRKVPPPLSCAGSHWTY